MHWLNKGLCVCCGVLLLSACAQDKVLPKGERISILNDTFVDIDETTSKPLLFPVSYINKDWMQSGINSRHVVGNLKASSNLEEIWANSFGKGITKRDILIASPVAQNGRIFVMDAKGKVSAFSENEGTLLWENNLTLKDYDIKQLNSKASGLAVDNGLVYATTGFGGVYAMDTIKGMPKWRKVLESPIRIAPTITPKAILVQTVDNRLYALDKMTGEELWRFGVAHEDTVFAGGATPAYCGEDNIVVAGFSNGEIVVLNANTGTPLWAYSLVSSGDVSSTTEINTIGAYPIIKEGVIYAISNGNKLVSLDVRTGEPIWEKEIGSMQNMLLVGEYLFVISNKNILYAIEAEGGDVMWSIDMREHIFEEEIDGEIVANQPIMLEGNILLTFSNGKVFRINASRGNIVAKTQLDIEQGFRIIVVNEKVVLVSGDAELIVLK